MSDASEPDGVTRQRGDSVPRAAAVVIGRNEGARLSRCLRSLIGRFDPVVYVDSASTDGSVETARELGAMVVMLDMTVPFTSGRARNAGSARALALAPDLAFIQFIDADSELVSTWADQALAALAQNPAIGAVHGRVRERCPETTIFNRLYDLELDPRSEAENLFGGMALLRVVAFEQVGRCLEMQAFEDHALAVRLRGAGWQIRWLDTDMAVHDADMASWREWWARERRAGHGRAQLLAIHGTAAPAMWWRAYASIWFWGALLPAITAMAALRWGQPALWLTLAYAVLFWRIVARTRRSGFQIADALLYAGARVAAKFPQMDGVLRFLWERRGAG